MTNLPAVQAHRIADLALLVQEVETYDQAVEVGHGIVSLKDRADFEIMFALGDLANKAVVDGDYETLRAFADEIGVEYDRLKDYARTASAWEPGVRTPVASFNVHKVLAADPNRIETLTKIMDEMPEGTAPTVQRAREARAAQLEIRNQAAGSSFSRGQGHVAHHGPEAGNAAEEATYEQASREQDEWIRAERRAAAPIAETDSEEGTDTYVRQPAARPVTNMSNVGDIVRAIGAIEQAVVAMGALTQSEGQRVRYALEDCIEMVDELAKEAA
jgi:hypothetical protein